MTRLAYDQLAARLRYVAVVLDVLTAATPPPNLMRLRDVLRGLEAAGPDGAALGFPRFIADPAKVDDDATLASDPTLAMGWEQWLRGDTVQQALRRWAGHLDAAAADVEGVERDPLKHEVKATWIEGDVLGDDPAWSVVCPYNPADDTRPCRSIIPCPTCGGRGALAHVVHAAVATGDVTDGATQCPTCRGGGRIPDPNDDGCVYATWVGHWGDFVTVHDAPLTLTGPAELWVADGPAELRVGPPGARPAEFDAELHLTDQTAADVDTGDPL